MSKDEIVIEKNKKTTREGKSTLDILVNSMSSNKVQNAVLMAEILSKPISKRVNRRVRR